MTFLAGSGGVYKSLAWRSGQLALMIAPLDLSYGSEVEVEVNQMHRNRLRSLSLDAVGCVAEWADVKSD